MALPSGMKNRPVTVVGGGTLGRRIALMFAYRGDTVWISTANVAWFADRKLRAPNIGADNNRWQGGHRRRPGRRKGMGAVDDRHNEGRNHHDHQ
jgi:3-hydroxybutyryl-CoA dehydrogenase